MLKHMPYAIQAENSTKTFGSFTVVDKISFTVNQGEIFGLFGPNGAGKTTIIKIEDATKKLKGVGE